jgi:hypothetical protein
MLEVVLPVTGSWWLDERLREPDSGQTNGFGPTRERSGFVVPVVQMQRENECRICVEILANPTHEHTQCSRICVAKVE